MSTSGMYSRARNRGDASAPPSITAVAFPVRTRKPMPADSLQELPGNACPLFRFRTGVDTRIHGRTLCPPKNCAERRSCFLRLERIRARVSQLLDRRPHLAGAFAGVLRPDHPFQSFFSTVDN